MAGCRAAVPAALSIITSSFDGRDPPHALAVWGAVGGAGAAIGVLLGGGTLTELVGWRAIFAINLPIGLALAGAATRIVSADTTRPRWRGLDLRGALVATASLAGLVYTASRAEAAGWTSVQTVRLGAASLLGLAAFALLELRTPQPLLRVQRLSDRAIGGGFTMMLAASALRSDRSCCHRCTCRTCSARARWPPASRSYRWRSPSRPVSTSPAR